MGDIDATSEGLGPAPEPQVTDYNPAEDRETARRRLSYGLLALLWVIVGALLIADFANWVELGEAKDLATAILAPIVVLVGTALGFYFGGNNS